MSTGTDNASTLRRDTQPLAAAAEGLRQAIARAELERPSEPLDPPPAPADRSKDRSTTGSAIYEGVVRHRRYSPIGHSFKYKVFMPLLDLDEVPELFDRSPFWSARRPALARFRREDYLGDPTRPLAEAARDLVEAEIGQRPAGPVRLLTHLRYLGRAINPVSFYYLWDSYDPDARVAAVIAEVTNTPWGESHCYVVERTGDGPVISASHEKELHVSPFMPMDQSYGWKVTEPGDGLQVNIENFNPEGEKVFDATLSLRRREITPGSLTRTLLTYPPMSLAVGLRIYWNALKLKFKGAPYFANPSGKPWEVWAERRQIARASRKENSQ